MNLLWPLAPAPELRDPVTATVALGHREKTVILSVGPISLIHRMMTPDKPDPDPISSHPVHWPIVVRDREHAYNDPTLSDLDFLRAVRDDRTVPLSLRMDAARACLPYELAPLPVVREPSCTIHISPLFSGHQDTHQIYSDFLQIVADYRQHCRMHGLPVRDQPSEFYVEIIECMCSFHGMHPHVPTQEIEFYLDLLHIQRCWEMTQRTGTLVSPDLESTPPAGHA